MSRILARVLGDPAGPTPVRPRLPTLFEPGLDLVPEQEDIAAAAARPDGSPSPRPEPARAPDDLAPGRPPVPGDRASAGQPAAEHRPLAASSPSGGPAGPVRRSLPPGAPPPDGAAASRPGGARQAHPVRPESALAPARPPAIPTAAVRPVSADGAARAIRPAPPAGPAPAAAAVRVPVHPRQLPDGDQAAPRRPATRAARGGASAEPVVHISIGRVEIRAPRADAPRAERPARQPRPAAPDLSEYLQRRGKQR